MALSPNNIHFEAYIRAIETDILGQLNEALYWSRRQPDEQTPDDYIKDRFTGHLDAARRYIGKRSRALTFEPVFSGNQSIDDIRRRLESGESLETILPGREPVEDDWIVS